MYNEILMDNMKEICKNIYIGMAVQWCHIILKDVIDFHFFTFRNKGLYYMQENMVLIFF